jgi:ferredoxin/flavodoxin
MHSIMKALIHYFTGNGNTGRAVTLIGRRLEEAGYQVELRYIDASSEPPQEIPDLTLVAYPTYSWSAPSLVMKYARKLPRANGSRAAVFTTRGGSAEPGKEGGFAGQGLEEMERILARRGYDVALTGDAGYPDTWVQAINPPSGEEAQEIVAKGDAVAEAYAQALAEGRRSLYRCGAFHTAWSKTMAVLFRGPGRRLMGKTFIADERCTSCGVCVKTCPARNITLEDGLPRWGSSCEDCCRCFNLCPEHAVQTSPLLLVIHTAANVALTVLWIKSLKFVLSRPLLKGRPLLSALAALKLAPTSGLALFLFQLTALDALLQKLANTAALRPLFTWSYTRPFTRYKAPGFKIPIRK